MTALALYDVADWVRALDEADRQRMIGMLCALDPMNVVRGLKVVMPDFFPTLESLVVERYLTAHPEGQIHVREQASEIIVHRDASGAITGATKRALVAV